MLWANAYSLLSSNPDEHNLILVILKVRTEHSVVYHLLSIFPIGFYGGFND